MRRGLITTLIWLNFLSHSLAIQCTDLLQEIIEVQASDIHFTQSHIGFAWAERKFQKLKNKFERLSNEEERPQSLKTFVKKELNDDPIIAIRDSQGKIRITDSHHTFYALRKMYNKDFDFNVHLNLVRDYSDGTWREEEAITDMLKNHFLNPSQFGDSTRIDLESIPDNIFDFKDSPARSLMGYAFLAFNEPLKGSYFNPHIQNKLAMMLEEQGIELFPKGLSLEDNGRRIKDVILSSPDLLDYLKDNLLHDISNRKKILKALMLD